MRQKKATEDGGDIEKDELRLTTKRRKVGQQVGLTNKGKEKKKEGLRDK
jgi:hypothetical protein